MKEPLTLEELRGALEAAFSSDQDKDGEWIKQMAEFILDFFGFDESILDNSLTPRDRDIFYILENAGLLRTVMEETTIHKGKTWRIHYWVLNRERISQLNSKKECPEECPAENGERSVYDGLSDKIWARN